jgi:hypothetical protein
MSDQSIAAIARDLAAALLAEARSAKLLAEATAIREQDQNEKKRVAALEGELLAAYRNELVETYTVSA